VGCDDHRKPIPYDNPSEVLDAHGGDDGLSRVPFPKRRSGLDQLELTTSANTHP